jgi:hypothetical protein
MFFGFSSWLLGSIASGPVMRQNIMEGVYGGAKLLTSWWLGSKETQEGVEDKRYPSRACLE